MINLFNSIAEHWYDWQIAMLWQTMVLIGIIWIVDIVIRKWAHPQVRYALWMLVLVKLLMPPSWTSPASITSNIPAVAQKAVSIQFNPAPNRVATGRELMDAQRAVIAMDRISPNGAATVMERAELVPKGQNTIAGDEIPGTDGSLQSSPNGATQTMLTLHWQVYTMFVWLSGIAVLSIWLIVRLTGLRKEHQKALPLQRASAPKGGGGDFRSGGLPEHFYQQLEAVAAKLNLSRIPRVILTDKVACPAVFGFFRPVLLMPAEKFRTMSQKDTEHILLHELAHIKRGDLVIHAVYMILQIVYWFNPLLWMIRRTIQNLRELCCDATVAKLLRENTVHYRQTLLETARQLLAEPIDLGLGLLGLFENNNWLVTRLQWLEKNTWKNRPLRITAIVVLIAVMTTCVLPMGVFDPGPPNFIIKGTVTDALTGQPIVGAKVGDNKEYNKGKFYTVTDANGNYEYKTWYEEHGTIAEADGYRSQLKGFNTKLFGSENERIFNFSLIPNTAVTLDQIMKQGEAEARRLNHEYIGTEHLLLALVSDEKISASVILRNLDVDAKKVRLEIDQCVKAGSNPVKKKKLPLTARAKKALKYAAQEAKSLDQDPAYSGHVLLGLLRVQDGVAAEVLGNLGITYDKVYQKIHQTPQKTPDAKRIQSWVEDFFKHNYRDITARKTIEWGRPVTHDDGTISIRYKYEAAIWDKDKIIENKVWTFDKDGKFIYVRKVGAEDIYSLSGAQALVENFFANNYRDITHRETIEWGQPVKHENGNVSIRYKYEATIWDKDKIIEDKVWTFNRDGKFISVEDSPEEKANAQKAEGQIDITPASFEMRFDQKRLTLNLIVSIENQSDVTIPKHRIRYYRGDPEKNLDETGNPQSGWHEAGPIEPGQTWNELTRGFFLPDGDYTFTVVLDYNNAIPEINEDNNRASLYITIQGGQIVRQSNVEAETENSVTQSSEEQFNWVVPFEITKQEFLENDWIEITQILGPTYLLKVGYTYTIKGKYNLSSHENAMLHIYATNGETQSEQGPIVERGTGEFTRTFTYLKDGWLHVSFYPAQGGSSFGNLYFAQQGSNQQVPDMSGVTSFVKTSKTKEEPFDASEEKPAPLTEKPIESLVLKDTPLKEALRMLAQMYKINIIPSQKIMEDDSPVPVTNLYDVTFEEVLQALCGTTHTYEIKDHFVYVYTNEEYKTLNSNNNKAETKSSSSDTWQSEFDKAIQTIQDSKNWPQDSVAVSKAFWRARADKDYPMLKILWPGSASWDQSGHGWKEICDADVTCEYVFGQPSVDGLSVPYASRDYFDENGSYDLKMLLSSINTKLGKRFYIISGN